MSDNPLITLLFFAAALYILKLWLEDTRVLARGDARPQALPGTSWASRPLLVLAAALAIVLVLVETAGEYALGTSDEQSTLPWLSLLALLGAGVIEEVVFRGYLVVTTKGKAALIGSIVGFSALFSILHVQYYLDWEEGAMLDTLTWAFDTQSAWTLTILFVNSLFFYTLRFHPANKTQSLLPCFIAHATSNAAVFFVKLAQGHIQGLW